MYKHVIRESHNACLFTKEHGYAPSSVPGEQAEVRKTCMHCMLTHVHALYACTGSVAHCVGDHMIMHA